MSLQGYVRASFADLTAVLGRPGRCGSPDGKVRVEWTLPGGTTIYDWKSSKPLDEITEWNVGGSRVVALAVVSFLLDGHEVVGHLGRPARDSV